MGAAEFFMGVALGAAIHWARTIDQRDRVERLEEENQRLLEKMWD